MGSKKIAVREDVYRRLSEAKKEGESFSHVINKLLKRGGDMLPLWGVLSDSMHLAEIEDRTREIRSRTAVCPRWSHAK